MWSTGKILPHASSCQTLRVTCSCVMPQQGTAWSNWYCPARRQQASQQACRSIQELPAVQLADTSSKNADWQRRGSSHHGCHRSPHRHDWGAAHSCSVQQRLCAEQWPAHVLLLLGSGENFPCELSFCSTKQCAAEALHVVRGLLCTTCCCCNQLLLC